MKQPGSEKGQKRMSVSALLRRFHKRIFGLPAHVVPDLQQLLVSQMPKHRLASGAFDGNQPAVPGGEKQLVLPDTDAAAGSAGDCGSGAREQPAINISVEKTS